MPKEISRDDVLKALGELEGHLLGLDGDDLEDDVTKASEDDLDQPEGGDMGWGANGNPKLSDEANDDNGAGGAKKKSPKSGSVKSVTGNNNKVNAMGDDLLDKSHKDFMDDEVTTKIDVSDFLKSMVEGTGKYMDNLRDALVKSSEINEARFDDLMTAHQEVVQNQAKLGVVLKAICERIGMIENSPAHSAKSDTVAKAGDGAPAERQFHQGQEQEGNQPILKGLNSNPMIAKSQIADTLIGLVKKGEAEEMDVVQFDTNGMIRPELMPKLQEKFGMQAN